MSKNKSFQSIRGMRDLIADDARYFEFLVAAVKTQLNSYGYKPFHTPILESTELFSRSIGAGTDVVEKEMFTFDDHGESLTMRPEATAGIVRAVVQHGMTFGSHKLWTFGPMFRRERPQKGRYRQFYQFSVEAFGVGEPEQDAEQIIFLAELWKELGIENSVKLHVNTLATPEVRANYRRELIGYFELHASDLDEDSHRRIKLNPLRILDSKNPAMESVIANAPKLNDFLDDESRMHFERVLACLKAANISYILTPTLVRGLDYYNHTVYEWITDKLGAQGTICGGGRYDGLAEYIGGKSTPAVGFGLGVDRTVLLMQEEGVLEDDKPLAYFVLVGENAKREGLILANALRKTFPTREIITHLADSSMKLQFKKADQSNADFAVIIGENELDKNVASIKNLSSGEQEEVSLDKFVTAFN